MDHTVEIEVIGHTSLGGVYDFSRTPSIDIGRSGACTVVLDDPLIAAKHCRIVLEHGCVVLKNLDQEIGVYCDGAFVEKQTTLSGKHEIDLGEAQLIVRVPTPEPTPAEPVQTEQAPPVTAEPEVIETSLSPSIEACEPEKHEQPEAVHAREEPKAEEGAVSREKESDEPKPTPVIETAPESEPVIGITPEPESKPEPEPEPEHIIEAIPEPELEPEPPRPAPPAVSLDSLPRATLDLVRPLADEFGLEVFALGDPDLLDGFISRLDDAAAKYGLEDECDRRALLRCMILIGDNLGESNSKNVDIQATLGLVEKPAEQRLRISTKIAQRIADERGGPVGLGVSPTPAPAHAPAATRRRAATPTAPSLTASPAPQSTPQPAPKPIPYEPKPAPAPAPVDPEPSPSARVDPPPPQATPAFETPARPRRVEPAPTEPKTRPPATPTGATPTIAGYDIESPQSGDVFPGRDSATGERVLVALADGGADDAHERVLRASGLVHRNLAKVLDSGEVETNDVRRTYMVIDDDTSTTLGDVLERVSLKPMATLDADGVLRTLGLTEGMLSPQIAEIMARGEHVYERLVLTWMIDIAEALQLAHDTGLSHAGLGVSCVLLDRHGLAVVRWLGRYDSTETDISRLSPDLLETLAPERVASIADGTPLPTDARPSADIWSLGVLGYSMLTGRAPFAASRGELLREIVTKSLPNPHESFEGLSESASEACMTALHRDHSRRPAAASAFAEILRAAAHGNGDTDGKKRFGLFGRKG